MKVSFLYGTQGKKEAALTSSALFSIDLFGIPVVHRPFALRVSLAVLADQRDLPCSLATGFQPFFLNSVSAYSLVLLMLHSTFLFLS
jgi:hypothetical protein